LSIGEMKVREDKREDGRDGLENECESKNR
jgi:hypothetical protein